MSTLSVVIITKNEEANLPRCLESVKWADEIIVVDSNSVDRSRDIAASYGARVHNIEWQGFGHAKQTGVSQVRSDWVLSIDADEEVTADLQKEILDVIGSNGSTVGYEMPRRTRFLGRWIYHCGWYPDPVLRLFRREHGQFDMALVHERLIVDGPTGRLQNELLHYSYPTLEKYFEKFNRYTTLGAREAFERGEKVGWAKLVIKPFAAFIKHFLIRRGFLDGVEGLVISVLSSCSVLVKYAKLRELNRNAAVGERRKT